MTDILPDDRLRDRRGDLIEAESQPLDRVRTAHLYWQIIKYLSQTLDADEEKYRIPDRLRLPERGMNLAEARAMQEFERTKREVGPPARSLKQPELEEEFSKKLQGWQDFYQQDVQSGRFQGDFQRWMLDAPARPSHGYGVPQLVIDARHRMAYFLNAYQREERIINPLFNRLVNHVKGGEKPPADIATLPPES